MAPGKAGTDRNGSRFEARVQHGPRVIAAFKRDFVGEIEKSTVFKRSTDYYFGACACVSQMRKPVRRMRQCTHAPCIMVNRFRLGPTERESIRVQVASKTFTTTSCNLFYLIDSLALVCVRAQCERIHEAIRARTGRLNGYGSGSLRSKQKQRLKSECKVRSFVSCQRR